MINLLLQAPDTHQDRTPWRERAACRGAGTDLFFPVGSAGAAADEAGRARQVCGGCLVRADCLAYAMASGQQHGIWGGHDEQERRQLRQQQRSARPGEQRRPRPGRA